MTWIDSFDKLHIKTKSVIISIVGLMPFWVIAFYLFKRPIYDKGDYLILGCFCFCFSVVQYSISLATALFMLKARKIKDKTYNPAFYLSGIAAVMSLTISILASYIFGWGLKGFLLLEFIYSGILLLKWIYKVDQEEQRLKKVQSEKTDSSVN